MCCSVTVMTWQLLSSVHSWEGRTVWIGDLWPDANIFPWNRPALADLDAIHRSLTCSGVFRTETSRVEEKRERLQTKKHSIRTQVSLATLPEGTDSLCYCTAATNTINHMYRIYYSRDHLATFVSVLRESRTKQSEAWTLLAIEARDQVLST